jgi:hypothetical protein
MAPGTNSNLKDDGVVIEMSEVSEKSETTIIFVQVRRFMIDCMKTAKCDIAHAEQLADVLIAGDLRGHYSHGLNRLGCKCTFSNVNTNLIRNVCARHRIRNM